MTDPTSLPVSIDIGQFLQYFQFPEGDQVSDHRVTCNWTHQETETRIDICLSDTPIATLTLKGVYPSRHSQYVTPLDVTLFRAIAENTQSLEHRLRDTKFALEATRQLRSDDRDHAAAVKTKLEAAIARIKMLENTFTTTGKEDLIRQIVDEARPEHGGDQKPPAFWRIFTAGVAKTISFITADK